MLLRRTVQTMLHSKKRVNNVKCIATWLSQYCLWYHTTSVADHGAVCQHRRRTRRLLGFRQAYLKTWRDSSVSRAKALDTTTKHSG